MNKKYIMRRKEDGKFFIKKGQPDKGIGVLTTYDPNKAAIFDHPNPVITVTGLDFFRDKNIWESVKVQINVVL